MMNTNFGSIEKSLNVETSIVPKEETKKPELPNVVLKKTGNGIPYFCEGLPIILEKKTTNKEAEIVPKKTIAIFKS